MGQLDMRNMAVPVRRRAAWRPIWPAAGFLLLGACAALGPPDIETSRAYQGISQEGLYERTLQALRASDLEVTGTDRASGVIIAVGRFHDGNWAECPQPKKIVEGGGQQHLVGVPEEYRRVELRAAVSEAPQGATLTLDPAFSAQAESELATTTECRTTGALERRILESVGREA